MSDSKLNSLGFDDDDVLSNLEKLKAKYTAYSEEETDTETDTEPSAEEESEEDSFFSKSSDIPEEQDFGEVEQEPDEEDIGDIFFSAYSGDDEDEVTLEQGSEFDISAFMNYEKEHDIHAEESLLEEEAYPEDDDISESFEIEEDNTETDDSYTQEEEFAVLDDRDLYSDIDEYDEDDEFADLDDDDDIVRIDADKNEDSPFAAALKEAANQSEQVKKVKEKQKNSSVKKSSNAKKHAKLPYIIIAVAVPILLWLTVFITDITLVTNWKTPFFCAQTYEYENGSRDYKGAFYQFQIHINDQGEVESVCLPWFVKGPNDSLK